MGRVPKLYHVSLESKKRNAEETLMKLFQLPQYTLYSGEMKFEKTIAGKLERDLGRKFHMVFLFGTGIHRLISGLVTIPGR